MTTMDAVKFSLSNVVVKEVEVSTLKPIYDEASDSTSYKPITCSTCV